MVARAMITHNGPHPPEDWAVVTAETVFPIFELSGIRRVYGMDVQRKIIQALIGHYKGHTETELQSLAENPDHALTPHDHRDWLGGIVTDLRDAVKGTEWEHRWDDPDVLHAALLEIHHHLASNADVHRQWHADRNPDNEAAVRYKQSRHAPFADPAAHPPVARVPHPSESTVEGI